MQNCVNAVKRYHLKPLGSPPNEARRIDKLPDASVAVLLVAGARPEFQYLALGKSSTNLEATFRHDRNVVKP